ncbi:MAG TPA: zinc-dependent metalloprotease [Candidatus Eremiobacteraceae bacterium]|nr:zinc-dependent metalloprotease [Candidatus Eremiobacteraceae bacterium]
MKRFLVAAALIAAASTILPLTARADDEAPAAFAKFTDGLTSQKGLFTVWRKSGKVYLELTPAQLNHDFILSAVPGNGLGGYFISAGGADYFSPHIVRFVRQDDKIAILFPNTFFVAPPNTPDARAIEDQTAKSVVGVTKVAAVDATTGDVVIEAAPLLGDVIDFADTLKGALGNPDPGKTYHLDADRSYYGPTKSFPDNTLIDVRQTWTADDASIIDNVPDPRAIEFRIDYNFIEPPKDGDYMPRYSDDRIGFFDNVRLNFGSDKLVNRQQRYIVRWNMQKTDPTAPMSPAKHPMVFYMSNTIPDRYRNAIRTAVLEWNKAFIPLGISDAVQVKDQPSDPNWDADDVRNSVLRWLTDSNAGGFLEAQIYFDPRTGQEFRTGVIFDADYVNFGDLAYPFFIDATRGTSFAARERYYGAEKRNEAGFGIVASRLLGDWPSGDVPQKYIDDFLIDGTLHEVGHDMGMMHNFIGSQAFSAAQVKDADFTAKHGFSSSVMEYNPINFWPKGQSHGALFMTTIGPYDYYAIHWAYAPVPGARTPDDELPTLHKWLAQSTNPWYRFASDEDVSWNDAHAIDPRVVQFDLTNDNISWCDSRMDLTHSLLLKLNDRYPRTQHPSEEERAAFGFILREYNRCSLVFEHYIGGEYLSRARPGDPGAPTPLTPVARSTQRRAWENLDRYVFSVTAMNLPPGLLNRLTYQEWEPLQTGSWAYDPPVRHDVPIVEVIGGLQRRILQTLYQPLRLQRIDEIVVRAKPGSTMTLTDLFNWTQDSVYGGLRSSGLREVPLLTRNLQAQYTQMLITMALTPVRDTPSDAQALARAKLVSLSGTLRGALNSGSLDEISRAHLENLQNKVSLALQGRQASSAP